MSSKRLTFENWLRPDEALQYFVSVSSDGTTRPISGEEWLNEALEPKLGECVPVEICELFEVARGALIYGFLFYPLYTVGAEQLFRVLETAVSRKCGLLKAPSSTRTFQKRIAWLRERGVISENQADSLEAARSLRNVASHPQSQSILPPSMAMGVLARTASQLNELFST